MTMLLDEYESEADYDSEAEDYGEADYDSEGEDYEDARTDAMRRSRARRIAQARRRMMQARMRRPATAISRAPTPRQTVAAIRNLDLESKVGDDQLRQEIARINRRAQRATFATVASVALDQAFDTFDADLGGHEFVKAGLRAAPLLLLAPQRSRPGVEGWLLDPRVVGAVAVAGIVAVGEFRERDDEVADVAINAPTLDTGSAAGTLLAIATNKKGADVGGRITWKSLDSGVLAVDENGGFSVKGAGTARVTATAGGIARTIFVEVKPAAGKTP